MADIKILGHSYKRWQVGAIAAGGAGAAWYAWKRHKAGTAAGGAGGTVTDPTTGQSYPATGTDPLTGMSYGSEIAAYGSVSAAEAAASSGAGAQGAGFGTGTLGGTSFGPTGSSFGTTLGVTSGSGFATNADWDQAVTAGLSEIGYSQSDVGTAIGRYLAGLSLTPDQVNIVNTALGEFGPPPAGAPPVVAAPATGTASSGDGAGSSSGGGSSSGSGSSGGGSSSGSGGSSSAVSSIASARVASNSGGNVVVDWTPAGPATQWDVTRTGPGGTVTNRVSRPQAVYENLARGHNFEIRIQPLPSGSVGGIDFHTN